jgi:hypothetical protein
MMAVIYKIIKILLNPVDFLRYCFIATAMPIDQWFLTFFATWTAKEIIGTIGGRTNPRKRGLN